MIKEQENEVIEKEMNIEIFTRTNKGIIVSKDGEDFLGYARQVLEQAEVLEDKYKGGGGGKKKFCISTQHYSFAVNAFVDLIKKYGQDEYDFSKRETQTYEIIEEVCQRNVRYTRRLSESGKWQRTKRKRIRSSSKKFLGKMWFTK